MGSNTREKQHEMIIYSSVNVLLKRSALKLDICFLVKRSVSLSCVCTVNMKLEKLLVLDSKDW